MSNHLAIATVTASLRQLLEEAKAVVPGAKVTFAPPSVGAESGPTIRLFLYQVLPNDAHRNDDLPTRRADGSFIQRPTTALDLYYLISFLGDDAKLEPQRLLGSAVSRIAAYPVLDREIVDAAIASLPQAVLDRSDLQPAASQISLTHNPGGLDEILRVWSSFFDEPFALSLTYVASFVRIDADVAVRPRPPVRSVGVHQGAWRIRAVSSVASIDEPLLVTLDGADDPRATALVGRDEIRIEGLEPDASVVSVPLDAALVRAAALRVGANRIQIEPGSAPDARTRRSQPAWFVLTPRVVADSAKATSGFAGIDDDDDGIDVARADGDATRVLLFVQPPPEDDAPVTLSVFPREGGPRGSAAVTGARADGEDRAQARAGRWYAFTVDLAPGTYGYQIRVGAFASEVWGRSEDASDATLTIPGGTT